MTKSELLTKKPKGGRLTAEEKAANRCLSSERVWNLQVALFYAAQSGLILYGIIPPGLTS